MKIKVLQTDGQTEGRTDQPSKKWLIASRSTRLKIIGPFRRGDRFRQPHIAFSKILMTAMIDEEKARIVAATKEFNSEKEQLQKLKKGQNGDVSATEKREEKGICIVTPLILRTPAP